MTITLSDQLQAVLEVTGYRVLPILESVHTVLPCIVYRVIGSHTFGAHDGNTNDLMEARVQITMGAKDAAALDAMETAVEQLMSYNNTDFIVSVPTDTKIETFDVVNSKFICHREFMIQYRDAYFQTYHGLTRIIVADKKQFIDQSGGAVTTYGILTGNRDGSNHTFIVSQVEYVTGGLSVYLNGQLLTQGASDDWQELDPDFGTFYMTVAPSVTDIVTAIYE